MRVGCTPTPAHDPSGVETEALTAEQAEERAAEMASEAAGDAKQEAEPPASDADRGAGTQGQGWSVTAGAKRAAEAAHQEWRRFSGIARDLTYMRLDWRLARDTTRAPTAEQVAGRAAEPATGVSDEARRAAQEAALTLAITEQEARDALIRPLEYSVLNWPVRPIGAEPVRWGLQGSSRLPRMYANFDEKAMGINLGQMRLRMHYWLCEGRRVFGLSMGRRADRGDAHIYPVHPSRYCIDLGEEDERTAQHGTLPGGHVGFMWQVVLDGVSFLLEGGYWDPVLQRWMVWADQIDPYTANHWYNPEATPTLWHPDWPVWGRGLTQLDRQYRPEMAPTHYWIPPVHCLSVGSRGDANDAVNAVYPVEGIHCRHAVLRTGSRVTRWKNATHAPVDLIFRRHREYPVSVVAAATGPEGAASSWPRSVRTSVGICVQIPANQPQHAEALEEEQQASGGGGGRGNGAGDLQA